MLFVMFLKGSESRRRFDCQVTNVLLGRTGPRGNRVGRNRHRCSLCSACQNSPPARRVCGCGGAIAADAPWLPALAPRAAGDGAAPRWRVCGHFLQMPLRVGHYLWGSIIVCSLFPIIPPLFLEATQNCAVLQVQFAMALRIPRDAEKQVSDRRRAFSTALTIALGRDAGAVPYCGF